ncbi:MAG: hypothetical protein RMA76_35005 [Deltaproteobacteria bacterium]|jgi:hypothetical protein
MKDDILEQIGKYKAPTKLPKISRIALALYEDGGFELNEEAVLALRLELESYEGDLKALTDANIGLGVFALYLRDTEKKPEQAEMIAALIRETAPKYQSIGERIVSALQDLAVNAKELLDKFSDRDDAAKARAPVYGEAGPEGSLPLKNLKPVGEPPPRRNVKKPKPKS